MERLRARLLLCAGIRGSVASANRFSSRVVKCLLLCGCINFGHALAFTLTCRPNPILVENADTKTGGDAYETPQCGRTKDATKVNASRYMC